MSNVFIVQELRRGDGTPMHDLTPARVYGDLKVLIQSNNIGIAIQPLVAQLRSQLRGFSDDDYLLTVGDPVAIGVATAIAAEMNRGRVNILKWDRQTRQYVAVDVNIRMSKSQERRLDSQSAA